MSNHSRLQILIRRAGIDQIELARRLCVSRGAVANWTTERQKVPEARIEQIAAALGCSVETLRQALPGQETSCD